MQKVKDDVYTLYKLSTQLKMKDVRKTFSLVKKSRQAPDSLPGAGFMPGVLDSEWWSGIMVPYLDTDKAICPAQSTAKLVMGSLDLETCENIALPLYVDLFIFIYTPPTRMCWDDTDLGLQTRTCDRPNISSFNHRQQFGKLRRTYFSRHLRKDPSAVFQDSVHC